MLYHGVDIVEVQRVRRAVERWGERFLQRVFTAGEVADCGGDAPRFASLAARWAAKEAFAKALGLGLRGLAAGADRPGQPLRLGEIEVVRGPGGRPELRLHGAAADAAAAHGIGAVALSLSHTAEVAIASVVAQSAPTS